MMLNENGNKTGIEKTPIELKKKECKSIGIQKVIYKTTNLLNGKIYIGKDARNDNTYFGSGLILKNAIKKYGIQNFKKEILETCNSFKELNEREIYWIKYYNSTDKTIGYNIAIGGLGGNTLSHLSFIKRK